MRDRTEHARPLETRDHEHEGHDKHAGHSPEMFRNRFWLSLALSLPVIYYAEFFQDVFGYQAAQFPGSAWVGPVLGTILISDAPALLEADLGVATGAGTDVAIESADLVLVEDDPLGVVAALKLFKATYRQDDSEPLPGDGLQRGGVAAGGGGARVLGRAPLARCRRGTDEFVHGDRRGKRNALEARQLGEHLST